MYLYELINWLTTVVDSLQISGSYKDEAYRAATAYIAQCLMVRPLPSPSFPEHVLAVPSGAVGDVEEAESETDDRIRAM
jgi:hypothetical protein